MNKINRVLLMFIAMVSIMLLAVGIDRGMNYLEEKEWESQREAFYQQSRADIHKMQTTIQTLSEDPAALTAYMEENGLNYMEEEEEGTGEGAEEEQAFAEPEREIPQEEAIPQEEEIPQQREEPAVEAMPEDEVVEGMYREPSIPEDGISDNGLSGDYPDAVSENTVSGNMVSGNTVSGNTVSGNTVSGNTVSGNTVSGNTVSGNTVSGNIVSGNAVSGNTVSGSLIPEDYVITPPPKSRVCASYEETMRINRADRETIAASTVDFSGMKIVCLGDSVTAGSNLDKLENYEAMSYPYQLGEVLNAGEVVNLGIGGSSIGRYWENAFVDRYSSIPADADIIIVMGGTNDGFCASERELGSLEERRERTFAGDLDELLRKLKTDYPEAEILLATPLPNILHDMLRKERSFLLPQSSFVKIMKQLGQEYGVLVIDLYNTNLLNTHDAAIIHSFMPDGVHGNEMGYRILAEHFAAELIRDYQAKGQAGSEV